MTSPGSVSRFEFIVIYHLVSHSFNKNESVLIFESYWWQYIVSLVAGMRSIKIALLYSQQVASLHGVNIVVTAGAMLTARQFSIFTVPLYHCHYTSYIYLIWSAAYETLHTQDPKAIVCIWILSITWFTTGVVIMLSKFGIFIWCK